MRNLTTGTNVAAGVMTLAYNSGANVATLTFPGLAGGQLPDGRYELTLFAVGITDASGKPIAADFKLNFHALAGDANGDATTNDLDLFLVWQNSGKPAPQQNPNADLNGSGLVDAADLALVKGNYLATLHPPAPSVLAAVVNNGLTQRSRVTVITLQFSGNVAASLSTADLQLRNLTSNTTVATGSLALSYNPVNHTATFTSRYENDNPFAPEKITAWAKPTLPAFNKLFIAFILWKKISKNKYIHKNKCNHCSIIWRLMANNDSAYVY